MVCEMGSLCFVMAIILSWAYSRWMCDLSPVWSSFYRDRHLTAGVLMVDVCVHLQMVGEVKQLFMTLYCIACESAALRENDPVKGLQSPCKFFPVLCKQYNMT